jgi:RNA recognition motif-containing protein
MATKLFIGSLAWATNDDSLKEFFSQVGTVVSASVIMDRETNRSKGFGFVEMSSDEEAKKAVDELNGKDLDGRAIVVNEARPREDRPRGDGGGGGGGGGYGRTSY